MLPRRRRTHQNAPAGLYLERQECFPGGGADYGSPLWSVYVFQIKERKPGPLPRLLKAMKNIFEYLPAAYENGPHDAKAREQMATASTMAGMAFANAFLGVCHSMAHKLGAYHHLPHGIANALLITDVMRFNAAEVPAKMGTFSQYQYPHCKERYVECADFLHIKGKNDDEKFENLIAAIEELKEKVGIKKTIKDYGVDEKEFLRTLDEMTEMAFDDQCTGANPRYPLMSEIKEMYLKAYYGK